MGSVNMPEGGCIAVDAVTLIYYIENADPYASLLEELFQRVQDGRLSAILSAIGVTEVLSKPIKDGAEQLVSSFKNAFRKGGIIDVIPVTRDIAASAAELRASHNLRTPDAIHLATAKEREANIFVTNDAALSRVSEVSVVQIKSLIEGNDSVENKGRKDTGNQVG